MVYKEQVLPSLPESLNSTKHSQPINCSWFTQGNPRDLTGPVEDDTAPAT